MTALEFLEKKLAELDAVERESLRLALGFAIYVYKDEKQLALAASKLASAMGWRGDA